MKWKNLIQIWTIIILISTRPTSLEGQWFKSIFPSKHQFSTIEANGNDVFIGTREFPSMSHLYRSIDGLPWLRADTGLITIGGVEGMAFTDQFIFAATVEGVWRSSNYGDSWVWTNTPSEYYVFVATISVKHHSSDTIYIFCAANLEGVYRSSDDGETWQKVNFGLLQKSVNSFALKDSFLFAGVPRIGSTTKGCIYRTSNYGESWMAVTNGLTDSAISCLVTTPFGILAGTMTRGVFLSTDNGNHWQTVNDGLGNDSVHSLVVQGSTVFVGTKGGVYMSTDSCKNWQEINEGLPPRKIVDLFACTSTMLYAEAYPDTGLWMRPISEVVPVRQTSQQLPDRFWLEQNYPNPFNPSTLIIYSVPTQTFITIRVFDVLGRKVETLVSGVKSPGEYQVRWNANGVPSGVYLCRLEADRSTQVRRMLLVR